jgi:hypothetical protein
VVSGLLLVVELDTIVVAVVISTVEVELEIETELVVKGDVGVVKVLVVDWVSIVVINTDVDVGNDEVVRTLVVLCVVEEVTVELVAIVGDVSSAVVVLVDVISKVLVAV